MSLTFPLDCTEKEPGFGRRSYNGGYVLPQVITEQSNGMHFPTVSLCVCVLQIMILPPFLINFFVEPLKKTISKPTARP